MIPRAYIAHSSVDKPYVDQVVSRLSRAHVVYDSVSFQPGDDLRVLIRKGLAEASLLVLFASRSSLDSSWVKFELDEYELKQIRDPVNRILVVGTEPGISTSDLPQWMRRSLALLGGPHPVNCARYIQQRLAEQVASEYQAPFVGREREIEEFKKDLFPRDAQYPAQALIISGLPGIGRRSFAARVMQDYLSLRVGPVIVLREFDTLDSLYVRLADEAGEINSRGELGQMRDKFLALNEAGKGEEFLRLLRVLSVNNEAPILIDDYGRLLQENRKFQPEIEGAVESMGEYRNVFCFFVRRRRVALGGAELPNAASYALKPLDFESTRILLGQHFRMASVPAEPADLDKLAGLIDGYPPLATLATKLVRTYGLPAVLADESLLIDFKLRTFVPLLNRLELSDHDWAVMRLLAAEIALPFDAITAALAMEPDRLAAIIRELVEYNLVVAVGDDYELSAPLREAVLRLKAPFSKEEFGQLARRLREKYWKDPHSVPPVAIVDAIIHALARSDDGRLEEFRDVIMPTALLRVAQEAYHEQEWEKAESFAKRALVLDTELHDARETSIKALAKQGKWAEAETELREVERRGRRRQFYLRGFVEWKRGDLNNAISAFRSALVAKDRSISVLRDLAHCLFRVGDRKSLQEAREILGRVRLTNRFVVDLRAQIAIARQAWEEAEGHLRVLKSIDSEQSYRHRLATYHARTGRLEQAVEDARAACSANKPRFEMKAQLADILIESRRFREAMDVIEKLPGRIEWQRDIRDGLRCKCLLWQGKWREAEVVWNGLLQKELPVSRGLKREILKQKCSDDMVGPLEKERARKELEALGGETAAVIVGFAGDEDE